MAPFGRMGLTAVLAGSLCTLYLTPLLASAASARPARSSGLTAGCGWSVTDSPALAGSSILYGVHAIAADDVWAVGKAGDVLSPGSLAEHWDGDEWSVVPTPNPTRSEQDGNVLDAVDATGPNDVWAVGSHIRRAGIGTGPLIVHFDGSRWRKVAPPAGRFLDSSLTGVVAIAPDDAWIVGARVPRGSLDEAPLAMHWDGTAWRTVRAPNPPGDRDDLLTAVTATGPDDVWAVGQAGERTTLTMHFDGTRWLTVPSPNPSGEARASLTGVVALAPDDVWADGTGGAPNSGISEHWDGTSWTLATMQVKGQFEELAGITAQADGTVWAVGLVRPDEPEYQTMAQRFKGTAWSITRTPSLDKGDQLESVTSAGGEVWSVGVTAAGPDFQPGAALILHRCGLEGSDCDYRGLGTGWTYAATSLRKVGDDDGVHGEAHPPRPGGRGVGGREPARLRRSGR